MRGYLKSGRFSERYLLHMSTETSVIWEGVLRTGDH
jgi:hypothetical protein